MGSESTKAIRPFPFSRGAIIIVLAAGLVLLVISTVTIGAYLGTAMAALTVLALIAGLGTILVSSLRGGEYLSFILLVSFLPSLRLILGQRLAFYAFDPVLIFAYVLWAGEFLSGRIQRFRLTLVDALWGMWLAWLFVASLFGARVAIALDEWALWFRAFLIYFYVAHRASKRAIGVFIWILALIVLLEGVLGSLQFATRSNIGALSDLVGERVNEARTITLTSGTQLFRVRGTLGSDTALAHWLELSLPVLFSLLLAETSLRRSLWWLFTLVMGVIAMVLTFTRGGWLGLTAGMSLVVLLNLRRLLRYPRLFAVMTITLVLMALAATPFASLIWERLTASAEDTISVRVNLNRAALQVIQDHPITGIGLGNFPWVAPDYGVGYSWPSEGAEHKVHNLYLALAAEGGVPALLLFLCLLAVAFARARQVRDDQDETTIVAVARGIWAGNIAVLIHGLVAWGLISYMVLPLWAFMLGMLTAAIRWDKAMTWEEAPRSSG
ncbi:MAG TPA: O-antigen ligase family protein [Caldilineae bacterium]|nr:O-antigen ligase family protein [Caldilineae bacterium]